MTQAEKVVEREVEKIVRPIAAADIRQSHYAAAYKCVAVRQQERIQVAEEALRLIAQGDVNRTEECPCGDYYCFECAAREALQRMTEEGR